MTLRYTVLAAAICLASAGSALAQDDAASLRQRIQTHLDAEETAAAATLAYQLREADEDDESNALAAKVLDGPAKQLTRVTVHCDGCRVSVEGERQAYDTFYVEAGTSHTLTAWFETGETERSVEGKPGQHVQLFLEPPHAPAPEPGEGGSGATGATGGGGSASGGGVSPIMLYVMGGLTLVAGGTAIWSSVDMNGDVDAYEEALDRAEQNNSVEDLYEAERLLRRGDDKERRTELLIGVTAGMAVVSGLIALAVDWSGGSADAERVARTAPTLAVDRSGARLVLRGAL